MGAFFQSLGRTIAAGVVVLIVLLIILVAAGAKVAVGEHAWWLFAMRWLHITAGVMWIGLLWYFNFVQTPSMPKIPDDQKPAISKVIAPAALFWFRWAAMATDHPRPDPRPDERLSGAGAHAAEAVHLDRPGRMARHDHVVQRLVHHLAEPEEGARHRAGRRRTRRRPPAKLAGMASRINTMLSIPMLYFMVAQSHGGMAFLSRSAYFVPGMPPRRLPGLTPRAANQPRFISSA